MTSLNRRNFLRGSAATAAALLGAPARVRSAKQPPNGNEKKIRLGIVRPDTHAYYYGIMLDQCDPLQLQKNDYVVHHYASNIYRADVLTVPQIDGFEIARVYDHDRDKASAFS